MYVVCIYYVVINDNIIQDNMAFHGDTGNLKESRKDVSLRSHVETQ